MTKKWENDVDYWSKLTPEERKWMKRFMQEYYYGWGITSDKAIHPKEKHKDVYNARNRADRDMLNPDRNRPIERKAQSQQKVPPEEQNDE